MTAAKFSRSPGSHPSTRGSRPRLARFDTEPVPSATGSRGAGTPASLPPPARGEAHDCCRGAVKILPGNLPVPARPLQPRTGWRRGARPRGSPGSSAAGTGRPPRPAPGRTVPPSAAPVRDPIPAAGRAGCPRPYASPAAQLAGKQSTNSCGTRCRRWSGLTDTPAAGRGRARMGPLRPAPPLSPHPPRGLRGASASPAELHEGFHRPSSRLLPSSAQLRRDGGRSSRPPSIPQLLGASRRGSHLVGLRRRRVPPAAWVRRLLLHGCHRRGLASARCLSLPLRPRAPLPRRQPHDTSLPWKWRGGGGGGGGERGGQAGGAEPPPRQRRYRSDPPRRCSRGARPRGAPRRGTAAHHRRAPAAERPAAGTLCPPRSSPLRSPPLRPPWAGPPRPAAASRCHSGSRRPGRDHPRPRHGGVAAALPAPAPAPRVPAPARRGFSQAPRLLLPRRRQREIMGGGGQDKKAGRKHSCAFS